MFNISIFQFHFAAQVGVTNNIELGFNMKEMKPETNMKRMDPLSVHDSNKTHPNDTELNQMFLGFEQCENNIETSTL